MTDRLTVYIRSTFHYLRRLKNISDILNASKIV